MEQRGRRGVHQRAPGRRKRVVERLSRRRLAGRRFESRAVQTEAKIRLRRFRQGSALAIALTGIILLLFGGAPTAGQETNDTNTAASPQPELRTDAAASIEQATGTIRELGAAAFALLPKLAIGLLILVLAGALASLARILLRRTVARWERADALIALCRIAIFLVGIAAALAVVAGDVRALLGSIGLVGLALSWALQTPIESFTGWLLNSFHGYYRVGDRIEVGEVFGDVYKIDILTTTVWEAGGPGKAVAGAQATGAMITFPNWEVLRSNVVNYSREFPFVWDEITLAIANESDFDYTISVLKKVSCETLGNLMVEPAERYKQLLQQARLAFDVEEEPSIFLSAADSWTNFTIRYLVPARTRRRWATTLLLAAAKEMGKPEHRGKIIPVYPRREVILMQGKEDER